MSLQQFLAFDLLEDCPIEPAQVPLTDERMLTQKVITFANPDFWDHLPTNKSGAWHRFSQNNLKYMVKQEYSMEHQLQELATITVPAARVPQCHQDSHQHRPNSHEDQILCPVHLSLHVPLYQVGATCCFSRLDPSRILPGLPRRFALASFFTPRQTSSAYKIVLTCP
jgi:hypothetical protein